MDNLGSYLKSQREERGIAIEEIASITKIHVRSLEMIEHSQWKALPPEPFIRGFLSAYSRYVGLDPNIVLEKYRLEVHPVPVPAPAAEVASETPVLTSPQSEAVSSDITHEDMEEKTLAYEIPKKNHQWKIWTAAIAAAAILVLVPFLLRDKTAPQDVAEKKKATEDTSKVSSQSDLEKRESVQSLVSKAIPVPSPETIIEKPTEKEVAKVVPAEPVRAVAEVPAPVPPDAAPTVTGAHSLTVRVKDKSWSKLVVDGKAPVQKTLNPDETYTYAADEKIKLVLGNSAGAEVLYNGEKVEGLKIDGTIRQFIFPNNSRFPQDPLKRKVATPEKEVETSSVNPDSGLIKEEN